MSDIEKYKSTRTTKESSIKSKSTGKDSLTIESVASTDLCQEVIRPAVDYNNDPTFYYASVRVDAKNISIKLRTSLIVFLCISCGIKAERRSIQKVLYTVLDGYKFADRVNKANGINSIIADKIIEYIVKSTGEGVDVYSDYYNALGGQCEEK